MEKFFLNTNFPEIRVVPVHNGKPLPAAKLAENIASLYRVADPHVDKIFVWVDREGRLESSAEIRDLIRDQLVAAGAPADKLWIGVPDVMTENWVLADEAVISEHFSIESYSYTREGQNGKRFLKEMFAAENINYKETKHGVQLMKKMRLTRSANSSPSAAAFIQGLELECWWFGNGAAE